MLFRSYKGLSRGASRTVRTALRLAGQQGCATADTGHLLLAMLQTAQGPAADFLRRKRVTTASLTEAAPKRSGTGQPHRLRKNDLSSDSRKAIEFAILGAHASSAAKAENEHLLCAMLEDTACTASIWLAAAGIEVPQAARECRQLSGQMTLPVQPRMSTARSGRPSEKYGRDLTRLAQEGRLDPVLCREEELERMVEILCRRQKNNPCLLGEPGVGKSALAEALAQAIASGQITPALRGKRVLALDMASMVAGTKYRGDFEERFKNLLEELYRDRSTILFIDEIHLIAGAGAAEGAIDAASILKPMLARGEIQLIGGRNPHHAAGNQPQALVQAELLGFVKQHLHAQADAQQRRACGGFLADRLNQAQLFQPGHAVLERTHTGQYQRIGGQHILGLAGHQGFGAKMGKGVLHAQQVRQAIVDDRHLFHTRRTSTPPARMSSFSSATVSFL